MKFLIAADPMEGLKPQSDTSLAFAHEALSRGHEVFWATDQDIGLRNSVVYALSWCILSCPEGELATLGKSELKPISSFDGVWIRKDPPFEESYVTLCWLLSLEEHRVAILNPTRALLRFHEKLIPPYLLSMGFVQPDDLLPTFLSCRGMNSHDLERSWSPEARKSGRFVTKPWLGYGGNGVEIWDSLDEAAQATTEKQGRSLIQPWSEEILTLGDRRVHFMDFRAQGNFVRLPRPGSQLANLAQGGSAVLRPLTSDEERICRGIERFLESEGICFAGVDLLAGKLSEVNITSPTGLLMLKKLGGPDLAQKYVDIAEKKVLELRSRYR